MNAIDTIHFERTSPTTGRAVCPPCDYRSPELPERDALNACEDHDIAEHAAPTTIRSSTAALTIHCDACHRPVGQRQTDKYDALGVDWALCAKCERVAADA